MPPPGKSQPPQRERDNRIDSTAPVPLEDDVRRPSSKAMRVARELRPDAEEEFELDRLKAGRDADADDLAAMLVRVASTERSRDASERRATGLEAWTLDLEAKVAEARTRADELSRGSVELREQLDAARLDVETMQARVTMLEGELAASRREAQAVVEVERVKRGREIDTLVEQHARELAALRGEHAASGRNALRDALETVSTTLDELDRLETETNGARGRLLEQARRAVALDHSTAPPPPLVERTPTSPGPTMPPPKLVKKKRRASAPPDPPSLQPITQPDEQLETFADLLDSAEEH